MWNRMRFVEKMRTEGQAANAYEEATDGCRRSVLVRGDDAPLWQRVKPDEELHPLAKFDCEKLPTHAWAAAAAYSS
jgi:hypothetical protein